MTAVEIATRLLAETVAAWSAVLLGKRDAAVVAAGRARTAAGDLLLALVAERDQRAEDNVLAMLGEPTRWTDNGRNTKWI